MRTKGALELTAARAMRLFGFPAVFVDLFEPFRHILDLAEERSSHVERALLRSSQGEAIAGTGVNLDNFPAQFVLLLQDQPGIVGGIFQFRDDGSLDSDVESFQHVSNEVVGQRPFLGGIAEKHADDRPHIMLDLDNEDFFLVADEDGTSAVGGENTPNLNTHYIILHKHSLL